MLLKVYNASLIRDREKTYLTVAASAADTSLTVSSTDLAPAGTSSNTWADNDYMIVGEIGSENAEVMQLAAAVTSSTSMTIDREGQSGGLRNAHAIGEPVYKINFNQVEFSRNSSDTVSGATVLTTINLQVDDEFTRYEDTSNTTGYGFARFKNATTSAFSSYTDGVNYEVDGEGSSRDPRTLWMLRKKVREFVDERDEYKLTNERIDDAINERQRDLAHKRLWSFFETERSFSSVDNQFAYDIPSTIQKVYSIRFDTQPLGYINKRRWDSLHFDTNYESADPSIFSVWNNQLLIWPRPSSSASTTNLNGAITSSSTTITVDSTSSFNRGDYYRFIIDSEVIYATGSTSTTFTGCLRGREGTTAASHSDDATVTERDIVYNAHAEPTMLVDTQDRTPVPEPEGLAMGAAMDLSLFLGKHDIHDRLKPKYDEWIKGLKEKYSVKQTAQFGRVKDVDEFVDSSVSPFNNPNLYPRDINS